MKLLDLFCGAGGCSVADSGRVAMGIDWMTRRELSQAIPPPYTEWIGKQMIKEIRRAYEMTTRPDRENRPPIL